MIITKDCEVYRIIILILQVRKLSHSVAKQLILAHTARKGSNWDLNPGRLLQDPELAAMRLFGRNGRHRAGCTHDKNLWASAFHPILLSIAAE